MPFVSSASNSVKIKLNDRFHFEPHHHSALWSPKNFVVVAVFLLQCIICSSFQHIPKVFAKQLQITELVGSRHFP